MSNKRKAPLLGLVFIIICLISTASLAQNRIVLNNGSVINNAEFKELKNNIVVFLQAGSLHDMEIDKIKWFEKANGETFYFDEKGTMYSKNNAVKNLSPETELKQASSKHYIIDSTTLINKKYENTVYSNNDLSTANALYDKGLLDAKSYYHSPATTLLGFVALPTGFLGIGGSVINICSNNPTNFIRNNTPELLTNTKNPNYNNGFKKGMQNKKIGNTLGGFGILCILAGGLVVSGMVTLF